MTTSTIKKSTALAAVIAAAAIAPPAGAAPIESMLPSHPESSGQAAGTVEAPRTVTVSSPSGFDWADAGIGAAGALSLLALGGGSILVTRRSPRASAG
jgi:hypothetical protein